MLLIGNFIYDKILIISFIGKHVYINILLNEEKPCLQSVIIKYLNCTSSSELQIRHTTDQGL